MPKEGDEFDSFFYDDKASVPTVSRTTYRYRKNGRTVDPVRIVKRKVKAIELRFSDDPWQPERWVFHYGDERVL